jgi:hypothetical protein
LGYLDPQTPSAYKLCPKNPFDESSESKSVERGFSKTYIDKIQFHVEKTSGIDLDPSLLENT